MYLGITGQRVKAKDLVTWGIATHYVPTAKLDDLVNSITASVTEKTSDKEIMEIVNSHSELTAGHTPEIPNHAEIRDIFQMDSATEIMKRLDSSTTPFAEQTRKMLTKMSPLSVAVVFEQIKRGVDMNIHDVFKMEYRMSQGFMNHPEFFEGVRALLVDKDKNPKWTHKHVSEVTKAEVDFFFDFPVDNNLDILQYKN